MMTKYYTEKLSDLRRRELELACLQYREDSKELEVIQKAIDQDFIETGLTPLSINAEKFIFLQERITRFLDAFDIVVEKYCLDKRTQELFLENLTKGTNFRVLSTQRDMPISEATFYRMRAMFFELYNLANRYKFTLV